MISEMFSRTLLLVLSLLSCPVFSQCAGCSNGAGAPGATGATGAQGPVGANVGNWFPVSPPDFTTFSWVNQNTASYVIANGLPVLTVPYQSTVQWNNLVKAVPGANFTATLVMAPSGLAYGVWHFGLSLQDNSGKAVNMMVNMFNTPGQVSIYQESSAGVYAGSETAIAGPFSIPVAQVRGLRIVEDGVHRTYYYSADGGTAWAQIFQEAAGTYLTPTKYGISMINLESTLTTHTTVYQLGATTP